MLAAEPLRVAAVQLNYIPGRTARNALWLPEEPAFGVDPIADALPDGIPSVSDLANREATEIQHVRTELIEFALEAERQKLEQLLEHCVSKLRVDLLVLPECCVSIQHLPLLRSYSEDAVIVAGLHYPRQRDVELSAKLEFDIEQHVGHNIAVVVGPNRDVRIVSKANPAQGEDIVSGTGPEVFALTARSGREYRLGCAICLDYLSVGHNWGGDSGNLDFVAIPALSREVSDFSPHRTRDYVRIFANHGCFGGSRVDVTGLRGPQFVTDQGVEHLPAGVEGICVLDFDRQQSKPTSSRATQNKLIGRTPIMHRGFMPDADAIVDALARLEESPDSASDSGLTAWIEMLADHPESRLLSDNISALRGLRRGGALTPEAIAILGTHISIRGARTVGEVRAAQASTVRTALYAEMDRSNPVQGSAEAWEAYRQIERDFEASVRPHFRVGVSNVPSERGTMQQIFALHLGPFDAADAVRTLPRQLNVLRSFAEIAPPTVSLDYRLSTHRDVATNQLVATFTISCNAIDASEELIDDLRRGLHDQLRVILVEGWSLSTADVEPALGHDHLIELRPAAGAVPPVKEDWSVLVDLLRGLDTPSSVQILCGTLGVEDSESSEQDQDPADHSSDEPDAGVAVVDVSGPTEASAAAYFSGLLGSPSTLGVRVLIGTDRASGDWLPRAVAHELFGSLAVEIETPEDAPILVADGAGPSMKLPPEEALRIVHPPYGNIQGRGLRSRRDTKLPLPMIAFPASGIKLGSATRHTGRTDETVNVRLDADARLRHLYVIGKTGSGKTNLLKNLVRQDIAAGRPIAVIDPHGELVDHALAHADERRDQVLLLDFGRRDYLPVLNPLTLDIQSNVDLDLAIEEIVEIVVHRTSALYTGPAFEDMLRLALESIVHPDFPVPPSLLLTGEIYRSEKARIWIQKLLANDELGSRWEVLNQMRQGERAEHIKWLLSKFSEMSREGVLRGVLGGHTASVSIEKTVYSGGILLVRLPETTIGPRAASFIGSLIFSRIRRALFDPQRRQDLGYEPSDMQLYVDEFQKFVGGGFELMVAEARKFGLGLTVAHQNLRQLEAFSRFEGRSSNAMLESLLGNVGNLVVMRVGRSDGERLSAELSVSEDAVSRIGRFGAISRVVVDQGETDAFTLRTSDSAGKPGRPQTAEVVANEMIEKGYWVPTADLESGLEEQIETLRAKWAPTKPEKSEPTGNGERTKESTTSFLDQWLEKRKAKKNDFDDLAQACELSGDEAQRLRDAYSSLSALAEADTKAVAKAIKLPARRARKVVAWARNGNKP